MTFLPWGEAARIQRGPSKSLNNCSATMPSFIFGLQVQCSFLVPSLLMSTFPGDPVSCRAAFLSPFSSLSTWYMAGRMPESTGEGGPDWLQLPGTHILLEETDGCPSSCTLGRVWAGNGAQKAFRSAPGMSVRELGGSLEGSSV